MHELMNFHSTIICGSYVYSSHNRRISMKHKNVNKTKALDLVKLYKHANMYRQNNILQLMTIRKNDYNKAENLQ